MKTVVPKIEANERKWYLIDAEDKVLGRLASQVATILRGKHKPSYSRHLDMGDHIIVVNADKIRITGRKMEKKRYTRYSGYPGGLSVETLDSVMASHPERVFIHAVKGMLPKNRLGRRMIKKLKVYSGSEHQHQAQKPEELPNHLRRI